MLRASTALLLAMFIFPVVAATDVSAEPVSCDAGPSWMVSDEAELTAAIDCYNNAAVAADYRITFQVDIAGTSTFESNGEKHVTPAIVQAGEGFSLTIDGAGNALTNSFVDTGFDHGLFVVRGAGTAAVTFTDLVMGPSTEFGLVVDGGLVRVHDSLLDENFYGVFMRSGRLWVDSSVIDDSIYGVQATGGQTVIVNSEINQQKLHAVLVQSEDTDVDIVSSSFNSNDGNAVRVEDGSVGINNSTFLANGLGGIRVADIYSSDGFVSITNSTLPGRFGPSAQTRGLGHIAMSSSIAGECIGFVVNFGSNTGGCFDTPEFELGDWGDNGCVTPLLDGCVRTLALLDDSPAIGAGECADTPHFDVAADEYGRGELLTDQRGEPRKAACDSGAYETPGQPMCDDNNVTLVVQAGIPLVGTANRDVILGTSGADVIDGAGGDDIICGGAGNDLIIGGEGEDLIFGEAGRDVIRGNAGADYIMGGDDKDRLLGGTGDDVLIGGEGDDFLGGFGGHDQIEGGPGDDLIFGGFGKDFIFGGEGDDEIHGLVGDDEIRGAAGNDVLYGDRGNDAVIGGDGDDKIFGGNANDILVGDDGDDELHGGKADDVIRGGAGTDLCVGNNQIRADIATEDCETTFGFP